MNTWKTVHFINGLMELFSLFFNNIYFTDWRNNRKYHKWSQSSFNYMHLLLFIWFRVHGWMELERLSKSLLWFQKCCPHRELLTICECCVHFILPSLFSPSIFRVPFMHAITSCILHAKSHVPTPLSLMHSKNVY